MSSARSTGAWRREMTTAIAQSFTLMASAVRFGKGIEFPRYESFFCDGAGRGLADFLPQKKRCLRVIVITFAPAITTLAIELNGSMKIVLAVEVDPHQASTHCKGFKPVQQGLRNSVSTEGRTNIEPLAFTREALRRKRPENHASSRHRAHVGDPESGVGFTQKLSYIRRRIPLNHVQSVVVLGQERSNGSQIFQRCPNDFYFRRRIAKDLVHARERCHQHFSAGRIQRPKQIADVLTRR